MVSFLEINTGLSLSPWQLTKTLELFGYQLDEDVSSPATYYRRGGVMDINPVGPFPSFRIEWLGDDVERIKNLKRRSLGSNQNLRLKKLSRLYQRRRIAQLLPGEFVVHEDHGIGYYRGIKKDNGMNYFIIEYAKNDRLMVPETALARITPYVGFAQPTIHRLGGSLWRIARKRAKESAATFARQLLELYSKRSRATRIAVSGAREWLEYLDATFNHDLTPDQIQALEDCLADLKKSQPMDRLICGDVGFGKTEIALRVAAYVASAGKQVAMISPTTILADQHYGTFKRRLDNLPIKIGYLSRVASSQQRKKTIEELSSGKIDIVIGTHRLLSRDVNFANLGLLIIDEEQRFGVRHKEHLRKNREHLDTLSLTATPIPRSLHLALSNICKISLILTPPEHKRPVKTFIKPFSTDCISRAIHRELDRRGQIYYLHNRIESIAKIKNRLQKIAPKAAIAIIHGRLPEASLLKTMHEFRAHNFDVLIATTIIENGLDLPNVNTLIVEDATRLGLAQAHQLRGRVGRDKAQGVAYFLYPRRSMTPAATRRLEILKEYSDLGSGYSIARQDLELRGAGNILGKEQSGAVNQVGLNLYYQMLSRAIESLQLS